MATGSETLIPGGFDDDADEGDPGRPPEPTRRGRRWRRRLLAALLVLTVVTLLVVATTGVVGYSLYHHYDRNITRVPDVFDDEVLPATVRPPQAVPRVENILLVGSDTRAGATTGSAASAAERPGAQRADTIMLVHLTADARAAWVVSFPRDSWVAIPGRGHAKLNAAYSYGGPTLLVATIERMTRIRVNHFVAVDFTGFTAMTDAIGGVEVSIDETVTDPGSGRTWRAGVEELDGAAALDFVRQRYGLPRGDLDRIERQQQFLLALKDRATDRGMLTRPLALNRLLDAATRSLTVDDGLTAGRIRSLARRLRHLHDADVHFVMVPVTTIAARRGAASVVLLDEARARTLYTAVRTDRLAGWGG